MSKFGADVVQRELGEAREAATLEMEQLLIGAVFAQRDGLAAARAIVHPGDFLEDLHARLFDMMAARADAGEPVNLTVMRHAIGAADLGGIGVSDYLTRLMRHGASTDPVEAARAVRRARQIREAATASAGLADALAAAPVVEDPTPRLREAIDALDAIVTENAATRMREMTLADAAHEARCFAEDVKAGRTTPGVPYGIPSLDRITKGIAPGQLVILAGRPGMGKSTVALHFASTAARADAGVGYFSLEMDPREIAQRAMSAMIYDRGRRLPYQAIAAATELSDTDMLALDDAERSFARLPLLIDGTPGITVSQIAARTRRLRTKMEGRGTTLGLIVVDHLGLVRSSDRYRGNRVQEISEITGAMKTLAREMGVGILLCSQLNRAVESRPIEQRRPTLSDLRDSGSIEQDADVVMSLFREEYYLEREPEKTDEQIARLVRVSNTLEIEVLKQRQGPTDRVTCFCDIGHNIVGELAR